MPGFLKSLLFWLKTKQKRRVFWQQIPQVLGRNWNVSVLGGYRADRGVTHWLSQPGVSAPASPKIIHTGDNASALASLSQRGCRHPQHQVLTTHSTAVPAVSYLPLSALSARGQIHPAPGRAGPAPRPCTKQPVSHPPASQKDVSPCPPPQNQAAVPGLLREGVLGWRVLAPEMSSSPGKGHCGHCALCSRTGHLWASSSPHHSPRSPQVSCGASAGRSLSG